ADATGDDLDVVRQVTADPTIQQAISPELAAAPAPVSTRQPGVLIDLARREVLLDGEPLNLTYKDFELLNYLVVNSGRSLSREELLGTVLDAAESGLNERTTDAHFCRLRAILGRVSGTVRTVGGQGSRFHEHPEVVILPAPEHSI